MEKFSFLPSLGFNWYPSIENSLSLSEQHPHLERLLLLLEDFKLSGLLSCKRSLKRLVAFYIIAHFGMSLFHDAHVVLRSIPDWINNVANKATCSRTKKVFEPPRGEAAS